MPKFVPRERKHKVRARQINSEQGGKLHGQDTNTAEIQPKTASERDLRRQALREQLRPPLSAKSRKKQKRLEKYIVRVARKHRHSFP